MPTYQVKHCAVCTKATKVNSYGLCRNCSERLEQEVRDTDSDIRVCQYLYTRDGRTSREIERIRAYALRAHLNWKKHIPVIYTADVRRQVYAKYGIVLPGRGRRNQEAV